MRFFKLFAAAVFVCVAAALSFTGCSGGFSDDWREFFDNGVVAESRNGTFGMSCEGPGGAKKWSAEREDGQIRGIAETDDGLELSVTENGETIEETQPYYMLLSGEDLCVAVMIYYMVPWLYDCGYATTAEQGDGSYAVVLDKGASYSGLRAGMPSAIRRLFDFCVEQQDIPEETDVFVDMFCASYFDDMSYTVTDGAITSVRLTFLGIEFTYSAK